LCSVEYKVVDTKKYCSAIHAKYASVLMLENGGRRFLRKYGILIPENYYILNYLAAP
jgi:hypothetical protein